MFLQDQGLFPCMYRNYLTAVKQFYEFTNEMHAMQVTAVDIEMFCDDLLTNLDRSAAYLKTRGLKRFFAGVEKVTPLIESSFETTDEKQSGRKKG